MLYTSSNKKQNKKIIEKGWDFWGSRNPSVKHVHHKLKRNKLQKENLSTDYLYITVSQSF